MFIFVLCQGRGQYIIRKGAIFFLHLTDPYTQAGDWKAKFPTLITLFTNMTISTLLIVTVCACKTRTQYMLGLSRSLCCSSVLQHWSGIYKRPGSMEGGGSDSSLSHDSTAQVHDIEGKSRSPESGSFYLSSCKFRALTNSDATVN